MKIFRVSEQHVSTVEHGEHLQTHSNYLIKVRKGNWVGSYVHACRVMVEGGKGMRKFNNESVMKYLSY